MSIARTAVDSFFGRLEDRRQMDEIDLAGTLFGFCAGGPIYSLTLEIDITEANYQLEANAERTNSKTVVSIVSPR